MKRMEKQISIYDLVSKCANEIKAAIYSAFVFLNINTDVVKVLMILMFFDTVFGLWKSFVMEKPIKVKILLEGVVSKAMILLIPMVLALVSKGLGYDFKILPDTVLKILVVAEGFSIFTSWYVIRTKKEPENIDIITMLISSIRKGLMSILNIWLKKVENPTEVEINKEE